MVQHVGAVGDLEGYVHWFDRATGTIAGRSKAAGDRVTNAPVAVNDTVYLINDRGELSALRAQPITPRAARVKNPPAEPAPETEAAPSTDAGPSPGG